MEQKTTVLLMCGGDSKEHEISLLSAETIYQAIKDVVDLDVIKLTIQKDGNRIDQDGNLCELRKDGLIHYPKKNETKKLHFAIPCFHGYPGETGDIQSLFDMMGLPYLGSGADSSKICFNKITSKLWFEKFGVAHTPFSFLEKFDESNKDDIARAELIFKELGPDIFVKASSQGSSIGCHHVLSLEEMKVALKDALKFSPYALIEKTIKARELEFAVYEDQGEIKVSLPGEINCPSGFYNYEEKYQEGSQTTITPLAKDIPKEIIQKMQSDSKKLFQGLHLKHLARFDFFFIGENEYYLNEINTFPGMASASLFPLMMKESGLELQDFLINIIKENKRA